MTEVHIYKICSEKLNVVNTEMPQYTNVTDRTVFLQLTVTEIQNNWKIIPS